MQAIRIKKTFIYTRQILYIFVLTVIFASCSKDPDFRSTPRGHDSRQSENSNLLVGTWVIVTIYCNNGSILSYSIAQEEAKITFYKDGTYYPHKVTDHSHTITWNYKEPFLSLTIDKTYTETYELLELTSNTMRMKTEGTINVYKKISVP